MTWGKKSSSTQELSWGQTNALCVPPLTAEHVSSWKNTKLGQKSPTQSIKSGNKKPRGQAVIIKQECSVQGDEGKKKLDQIKAF